jgi:hypothetical protein
MRKSIWRAGLVGPALMAVVLTVAPACGSGGEDTSIADDTGDMPGTAAPAGASVSDVTERVSVHLARMAELPPDSLVAALPTHRQVVANMLSQMNREMSDMNMAPDAAWTGTVDSLRADLTSMPGMDAAELAVLMPAHRARVEHLMSMHAAMMRGMGM